MDIWGYLLIVVLLISTRMIFKCFTAPKNPDTGYIRRKSPSDINVNVPITGMQLEDFVVGLDEALISQRDFIFSLQNETYEIPYHALSNADWRYNFQENSASGLYQFDLSLKAGISVISSKQSLSFEEFKALVHPLALALKNQTDFRCECRNQPLCIPFAVLQQGRHRFEYEYEQKSSGKTQYELEFHIRSAS